MTIDGPSGIGGCWVLVLGVGFGCCVLGFWGEQFKVKKFF
jgi:hypothetical protein